MRKLATRTLLALAGVLGALLLGELALRLTLTRLPAALFAHQARELRTLAQSSKAALVPRAPWVAVLGDSFAEGMGDWLIENRWSVTRRHQATHLLHERLGLDVVSLARAGAGSYDGPAVYAVNTLRLLRRLGFAVPDPDVVVVYFYEGNDVADDLRFVERHWDPRPRAELFDDAAFARFEAELDARFCAGRPPRWHERFLAANLLSKAVESRIYVAKHAADPPPPPGSRFRIELGGEAVALPDALDADLLGFTEADFDLAVRLTDRGLRRVAELFPSARRLAVHICATNTTYRFLDAPAPERLARSLALAARVEAAARAQGYEWVDATAALRAAGETRLLHGPRDWGHLNRAGYAVLADAIAAALEGRAER